MLQASKFDLNAISGVEDVSDIAAEKHCGGARVSVRVTATSGPDGNFITATLDGDDPNGSITFRATADSNTAPRARLVRIDRSGDTQFVRVLTASSPS